MRIVVTGDADEELVSAALDMLHIIQPITEIVEAGDVRAGLMARFWAEDHNVPVVTVRGETPNQTAIQVFKLKPKYVLAFPWYDVAISIYAERRGVQIGYAEVRDAQGAKGQTLEDDRAGSPVHPDEAGDGFDGSLQGAWT